MALPGDVSTCTVGFGPYKDATGQLAFVGLTGTITPSRRVLDIASGEVVVDAPIPVTIGSDGMASVVLPHTDQAGITPTGFVYSVEWKTRLGASSPGNLPFALPVANGTTADFDVLAASSEDLATTVVAYGPQGPQGPAGVADDSSVAALVRSGSSATAAELRAAFVPKWKPSTAYASGEFVLNPSGQIVSASSAFTSGTTYSASNWTVISAGTSYTDEQARDAIGAALAVSGGLTKTVDDAGDIIGLSIPANTFEPAGTSAGTIIGVTPGGATVMRSWTPIYDDGYAFPARLRPLDTARRLLRVRNTSTTASLDLAYGSGDNSNYNNPGTWPFTVGPGQEWVDSSGDSRALFARETVSGIPFTCSIYSESAVA